jgi:hypothetical protein
MNTFTDWLSTYSYTELIDLYGTLTKFYPEHSLLPWVEQEIEIREIELSAMFEGETN